MIARLCALWASYLPVYKIRLRPEEPYLDRYYVAGPAPSAAFGLRHPQLRMRWLPVTIYLHCFWAGDHDRDLHNHPWWAVSLILVGGYVEEYLHRHEVRQRTIRPGRLHVIRPGLYHRVDLRRPAPAWTLIAVGRRVQTWGYIDRVTLRRRPAQ